MFESAELSQAIDKEAYTQQEPELRQELLERPSFPSSWLSPASTALARAQRSRNCAEWLDPRHLVWRSDAGNSLARLQPNTRPSLPRSTTWANDSFRTIGRGVGIMLMAE